MMTRKSVGATLLIFALPTVVAFAAPSYDNMYPTSNYNPDCPGDGKLGGPFCQTDNSALNAYVEESVSQSGKNAIVKELRDDFGGTDLTVSFPKSPVYKGGSETDIIYQVGSGVPSGSDGITWCDNAVTSRKCDQHYIRYRSSSVITTGLACHESGHAVGLTHGQQAHPKVGQTNSALGCMVTPVGSGRKLGSNNYYWINATY